jgi:hypothetical protein
VKRRWDEICCPFLNRKSGKIESLNADYYYLSKHLTDIDQYDGTINHGVMLLINDGTRSEQTED